MDCIIPLCKNIYKDSISPCVDNLHIFGLVSPNTTIFWVLTDSKKNTYYGQVTSDANGELDIDLTSLPDGLLSLGNGAFTLVFKNIFESCDATPIDICGVKYDGIVFTIQNHQPQKNFLGCNC